MYFEIEASPNGVVEISSYPTPESDGEIEETAKIPPMPKNE